jgi:hypothetical protein
MGRANRFLVTFGLALLPFAAHAECAPEMDAESANQPATMASAVPAEDCLNTPAAPAAPAPSAAQAPSEAPTQPAVPAVSDTAPLIQEVVAASASVDPAAGYQKKTEFDNTPYRFNAEKGFTAAEFDAWMASRGIRIATGKPTSTLAAASVPPTDAVPDPATPAAVSVSAPVLPTPSAPAPASVVQPTPVATFSTGCSAAGQTAAC